MGVLEAIFVSLGAGLLAYALFLISLVVVGRNDAVRAVAGFIPDCLVLLRRLLADGRIPRRRKLVLAALIPYLALPFDLVPDFIPVAGYLDDALIVAFVLRRMLRGSGAALIAEHWPGPEASLRVVLRLAAP